MRTIEFSNFEIDLDNMDLYCGGEKVKIGRKPLDTLLFLIQNRHKTVNHETLREHIWRCSKISTATIPMCVREIRKALSDNPSRPRFISSSKGRGYRFIDEIRVATTERHEADAHLELPFVGRKSAIDSLINTTRSTLTLLQGSLINIVGEAGIGKSRLITEFSRIAAHQFDFIVASTTALNQGAPFSVWAQALRLIRERYSKNRQLNKVAPVIASLLHDASEDWKNQKTRALFDRAKLFDTWSSLIRTIPHQRPLVIALEDLHHADEDSILLLDHLARELSTIPIAIITTTRPSIFNREGMRPMSHLFESGIHATLRLHPLSTTDIELLLDPYNDCRESIAAELFARTSGIPYYVTHLIRSQASEIYNLKGNTQLSLSPTDAIGMASNQFADLPDSTRQALDIASIAGTIFPVSIVANALEISPLDAIERLAPAVIASLVKGDGINYEFTHSILRDSLYQAMNPRVRLEGHRAIATILTAEKEHTASPSIVFHHLKLSIPSSSPNEVCHSGLSAGNNAIERFAYLEANRILRDALNIAENSPDVPTELRINLMISLSRSLIYSDRRDDARILLIQGGRLARGISSPELLAQCGLAMAPDFLSIEVGNYDPELMLILRQSIDSLAPKDSSLRARALARVSLMTLWCPAERLHAAEWARQSIDAARISGDPGALISAMAAHADAAHGPDLTDERIARVLALRETVLAHADERSFLIQQTRLIAALLEKGEVRRVYLENERYREVAEAIGLSQYLWYPGLTDSMLSCLAGKLDEAEFHAEKYKRLAGNTPDQNFVQAYACQQSLREIERDCSRTVLPIACEFAAQQRSVLSWAAAVAWMQWDSGLFDAARETLRQFSESDIHSMFREVGGTIGIATLSEVAAFLGDARRATLLLELTLPVSNKFATAGYGIAYFGAIARSSSLLAISLGRQNEAISLARSAINHELATGSRSWLIYAELDLLRAISGRMEIDRSRFRSRLLRIQNKARDWSLPRAVRCVENALMG